MKKWMSWLACTALGLGVFSTQAAEYPNKPIRFTVPYSAGGGNDLLARELGKELSESLGQPVVVENRPGAGGNIGADYVARSAPDGYSILLSAIPFAINPALFENLPFDVRKDFAPISLVATNELIMTVHPSVPAKNVQEFIAYAKSQNGGVNYATPGIGTPQHLAGELFQSMAGVEMMHVPYKGASQMVPELVAGRVHLLFGASNSLVPQIQAGAVRALAAAGNKRSTLLPDLPTVAESGLPGFGVDNWYGVLAPAGTPPAIVDKLSAEIAAITHTPEFRERLLQSGFEMVGSSAAEFSTLLNSELDRWAKVVKDANIKVGQ